MVFNNMLLWGDSGVMDTVTVTIAGRNVVKEYDGSTQSVSGYTVTSISDPNYTTSDFIFSGSAAASGKNVGTYNMNLTASQFTNVNTRFKNVVFTVTDGYVRVTPKNVTVVAVAKSKTYDNNASTDPTLTATVTGLIGADTITYTLSRVSGQNAGQYTITPSGNATQGNYVVNYSTAKFTINPASCTLTANSGTKTYNKASQSVTGYTCSVSGLAFSGVSASGSGTNAGTYSVKFSGVTVNTTKDTTGNYKVTGVTNGTLTINPASVTLTANSGTKTFNGSNQSVTGFTASVSGLTFSGVSASGTGKNAGSYSVTFTGVTVNTTTDSTGNYKVTAVTNGTLTINPASVTLTANSGTFTYDGTAKSVSGYTCSVNGLTFTGVSASASRTNAGTTTVTFTGVSVNTTTDSSGNYLVTTVVNGSLVVNKRNVTVTVVGASDATYTYDGSSHSISGYTVTNVSYSGYTSSDYSIGGTTSVSRTNAGTSSQAITGTNNNANFNATFSITNGKLTINKLSVTVTIHGASNATYVYDGNNHTITGYTVYSISSNKYTTNDFTVGGTITVTKKAVGTYSQAISCTNNNSNFSVTWSITNGTLTIRNPSPSTLTVSWATGKICALQDPDGNTLWTETSGYKSINPSKTGTYIATCANASPMSRSVNVTSLTEASYFIAW